MNELEKRVIIALADNRLNITDAAMCLNRYRTTVIYHVEKIKRKTGLDPLDFHDMCQLYRMAIEGREDNG